MKIIALCTLTLFAWIASSPATAQPKLETETFQIDLGMASAGTIIRREIVLRNTGTQPLIIEKAQTSCPCTTVALPEGSSGAIAPGKSLPLQVQYDTEDRHGSFGAAVVVHSNDPEQPIAIFELGVVITKPVVTDPPDGFNWGLAPRGHAIDKPLIVRAGALESPIELIELRFAFPGISAETSHETEDGKERLETRFTLAPDLPLGAHQNEATIRVRVGTDEHELRVPVQGGVLGDVLVTPPAIISPRMAYKSGDKISEITVQSSSGTNHIRVVGAPTTGPLETHVRPRAEGDGFVIDVLAAHAEQSGPQSATVYVMSTSKDEPVIGVPVYFRSAGVIAARPFALVFNAGDTTPQRIELVHVEGEDFRILDATCPTDAFTPAVERSASTGPDTPAAVIVTPSAQSGDASAGILEIRTDANGGATIHVPVLLRGGG